MPVRKEDGRTRYIPGRGGMDDQEGGVLSQSEIDNLLSAVSGVAGDEHLLEGVGRSHRDGEDTLSEEERDRRFHEDPHLGIDDDEEEDDSYSPPFGEVIDEKGRPTSYPICEIKIEEGKLIVRDTSPQSDDKLRTIEPANMLFLLRSVLHIVMKRAAGNPVVAKHAGDKVRKKYENNGKPFSPNIFNIGDDECQSENANPKANQDGAGDPGVNATPDPKQS